MALAFGLAGNAVADNTTSSTLEVTSSSNKKMSHKTVSLKKTIDFYQGDFLSTRNCLLYTSPSPRDRQKSRMPSSA